LSFTISEIAKRYRVSRDRVRGWIRRGELLAVNVGDERTRYVVTQEHVEMFERRRTVTPTPAATRRRRLVKSYQFYPD
jgi:excisionase family DNA binding protein